MSGSTGTYMGGESPTKMPHLARAIALAAEVHENQFDKGGKPYILHPLRVMQDELVVVHGGMAQTAAVLHDTLEDTKKYQVAALVDEIRDLFGREVLEWVQILTKGKNEDYLRYIDRMINIGDPVPVAIKLADLRDNMNILRQPTLDDRSLLRIQRYHLAFRTLREATEAR